MKKIIPNLGRLIISLLILKISFFSSIANAIAEGRVNAISVSGNQRIETSTVKAYLGMEVGDNYNQQKRNDSIKSLYATTLFDDISISYNAGTLNVYVKETPLISRVIFAGNTKVKQSILASQVGTTAGESLKRAKLASDVEKIKEIYKRSGRFTVGVNARLQEQENNRVKVIFEIKEGPKTGIKKIRFVGNRNYKDSELRSIVMTRESRWFRFLETNDVYDPDRIEMDKYLLKQFYNSVGYADFRVLSVSADLGTTRDGFVLSYSIDEGEKYEFGDVKLVNKLSNIKDSEISRFIKIYKGKTFNMKRMDKLAENISEYLAGQGYPQVDVYPDISINRADLSVDVDIVVDEARRIFINKINIDGNLKTEDHVIRRQLKIAEGDLYNRNKIERGQQNIRNLDYFEKMNLSMSPTKYDDRYDIDIDVEEKSTASIGLDMGYNTAGGPFGRIAFLERNLIGTGRYLNASAQAGRKNTSYNLGLTDPNFMDKGVSLGGSVFRTQSGRKSGFENGEQNYSLKALGGSVSLGYDITEDLSHDIDYLLKEEILRSPGDTASIFIKEQMGKFVTSSIGHSLTYDRLDSRVIPKNGFNISVSQHYAGLGGNTSYLKHEIDTKMYKSFNENKYTFKLSASTGMINGMRGKKVRISDRFNLGDASLRGFEHGGVGPRDKVTGEGLGGQKYYTLSGEVSFPLGLPEEFNITGALFVDAGALWDVDSQAATARGLYNDKDLRSSWGFGFLWNTRIAPIRVDWGFPIKKKKYDETRNFHIRFTTHI